LADAPEDVIVGFDGSPHAEDALGLGRRLAEAISARLVVANVFFVPRSLDPARLSAHEEDERMRAQGMLTIAAAQVDYPDVEYVAVGSASAARGLHDLADERDAVALVVGSTDRGDVGAVAPGSVARRLLSGAPCAVAIAPRGGTEGLEALGVAYDGTDESRDALHGAVRLAPRVGGHVDVLGVVRWTSTPNEPHDVVAGASSVPAELRADLERQCEEALTSIPESLRGTARVQVGDPAELLAASSHSLDLLVCGSRSHGRLHQVLLGSVSAQLVDRARCSVLVVPRGGRRVDESRIR
jgi:nucleotide-binding universal stress UspA family protein